MESTLIKGNDDVSIFVDEWEGEDNAKGVWLSIQTRFGGAHCTFNVEQAREMIAALKAVLGEE